MFRYPHLTVKIRIVQDCAGILAISQLVLWLCRILNSFILLKCRFGMAGETNVQGEKVKKLDVIANQLMINMLRSSYTTCVMVSEENEAEIEVDIERQVIYLFV